MSQARSTLGLRPSSPGLKIPPNSGVVWDASLCCKSASAGVGGGVGGDGGRVGDNYRVVVVKVVVKVVVVVVDWAGNTTDAQQFFHLLGVMRHARLLAAECS